MDYKLSTKLLSRNEVISEAVDRLQGSDLTDSYEDTVWVMNVIKEVVNDPYDTLNHEIPTNILNDENKLSDYFYLMAEEVEQQLKWLKLPL